MSLPNAFRRDFSGHAEGYPSGKRAMFRNEVPDKLTEGSSSASLSQCSTEVLFLADLWLRLEEPVFLSSLYQHRKGDLLNMVGEVEAMRPAPPINLNDPYCQNTSNLIGQFNYCALLQLYYGDIEKARRLLERTISIATVCLLHDLPEEWGMTILGSSINLGRLAGLCGEVDVALSYYRTVFDYVYGTKDLSIGGVVLAPGLCDRCSVYDEIRVKNRGNVKGGAMAAYVQDSIKALLISRDYKRLLAFLSRLQRDSRIDAAAFQMFFLECRVRALAGMGHSGQAVLSLREALSNKAFKGSSRPGLMVLLAQLQAGNSGAAAELVAIEEKLIQAAREPQPWMWYLLYRCGLSHIMANRVDRALYLIGPMMSWATGLGDQIAIIKTHALRLLALQADGKGALRRNVPFIQELALLLGTIHYRVEVAMAFSQLVSAVECDDDKLAHSYAQEALARIEGVPTVFAQQLREHLYMKFSSAACMPSRNFAHANGQGAIHQAYSNLMQVEWEESLFSALK